MFTVKLITLGFSLVLTVILSDIDVDCPWYLPPTGFMASSYTEDLKDSILNSCLVVAPPVGNPGVVYTSF